MSAWLEGLEKEPWRHDFFAVLRRLERSHAEKPRIGDSATLREDFVTLGQDPYFAFPASTLADVRAVAPEQPRICQS